MSARAVWSALSLSLLMVAPPSSAMQTGLFAGPNTDGFVKIQEYYGDGNADGVNETRIRRFKNMHGDRMFTMTTKNQLWASSVDAADGDDGDLDRNYVLRDSDCDGRFDERYGLDESFNLPTCLE